MVKRPPKSKKAPYDPGDVVKVAGHPGEHLLISGPNQRNCYAVFSDTFSGSVKETDLTYVTQRPLTEVQEKLISLYRRGWSRR